MIDSMSSGIAMPPPPRRTEQNLTNDQQAVIADKLAEYDVDTLTQTDALSIVEAFSAAGIEPGAALEKAVAAVGFDAKTIGGLAHSSEQASRPPPPPPKQSAEQISSMGEYLAELLDEKLAATNNASLSDEDKQLILAQVFDQFNIEQADSIINTSA
jgi:hypothetical protein